MENKHRLTVYWSYSKTDHLQRSCSQFDDNPALLDLSRLLVPRLLCLAHAASWCHDYCHRLLCSAHPQPVSLVDLELPTPCPSLLTLKNEMLVWW
jgi:hypothetical protein